MSKPKLYLHIGTHKTGTTTIQKTLNSNQKLLKKHKLILCKLPRDLELRLMHSTIFSNELVDLFRSSFTPKGVRASYRYLYSWEGMSGLPEIGYSNSKVIAKMLYAALADKFNLKIIVYLRRQDNFIESIYTQKLNQGDFISFEQYLQEIKSVSFNWYRLVSNYANHFGKQNLIIKRYEKDYLPDKDSLIKDFSKAIDLINTELFPVKEASNKGLSRDAIEVIKFTYPHLSSKFKKRLLWSLMHKTNPKRSLERYNYLNDDLRLDIVKKHSESNELLAQEFLYSDIPLFKNIIHSNTSPYDGLSNEKFGEIFADFINNIEYTDTKFIKQMKWIEPILKKTYRLFIRK